VIQCLSKLTMEQVTFYAKYASTPPEKGNQCDTAMFHIMKPPKNTSATCLGQLETRILSSLLFCQHQAAPVPLAPLPHSSSVSQKHSLQVVLINSCPCQLLLMASGVLRDLSCRSVTCGTSFRWNILSSSKITCKKCRVGWKGENTSLQVFYDLMKKSWELKPMRGLTPMRRQVYFLQILASTFEGCTSFMFAFY
jgi:hypothetical protein